jgi:F-type H+-transporting ATPase subunit b
VLTAVVTSSGSSIEVSFPEDLVAVEAAEGEGPENDLNPIAPEPKEMLWGFGSFVVMAIAIRYWLFPIVREGMKRRYDHVHDDFEQAETLTAAARAEVAEYEAQVASVRADAHSRVDAARATLEAERSEKVAEVNARINDKKAAATAQVESVRVAAEDQVNAAVAEVVTTAGRIATGRTPSPEAVSAAIADASREGVSA